jgi:DNA-binding CsgD family transcriptional regulator
MNPHTVQPGLYFREHIRNQQFQNTNLDLQDKFKIDFTFRIIQKKGNITEQFCFGRLPDTKNYDHLVVNKLFGIYDFTHDFQKVMADVLKKMAHDALDISCDMQAADATTIGIPNFDLQKSSLKKENYTFLASLEFTLREIDYLKFYFKGYSAKSIGEKLFVSPRTVEGHVMRLKDKLGCHNKAELLDTLQVMKDAHIHPEIFSGG